MRYIFPILLLAASILLCVCAAPSVVSTLQRQLTKAHMVFPGLNDAQLRYPR